MSKPTIKSTRDEFNSAIDFALDELDVFTGADFLAMWREGQWPEIEETYPQWKKFRVKRGLPEMPASSL